MRLLAAAVLAMLPAAAEAVAVHGAPSSREATSTSARTCPDEQLHFAYRDGQPLRPHKLNELPPADVYIAVFRHDADGCLDPIIAKYGVGRR